ncbi:MAG: hypothetical protein QME35_03685 [Thermoanaerobacteraceae bacterium]|nr:hypothetical protein [Thermoanaerobacteraceae bacterium]
MNKKPVFILSPIIAALITGCISWFFGGAMPNVAFLYGISAVLGAAAGILTVFVSLNGMFKELESARENISVLNKKINESQKDAQELESLRAKVSELNDKLNESQKASQEISAAKEDKFTDIKEMKGLVEGFAKAVKTVQEIDEMRSIELDKAINDASVELSELEKLMKDVTDKVSDVKNVLNKVGGGA